MKFLTELDAAYVQNKVDKDVKNKWNWNWLQESVDVMVESQQSSVTVKLGSIFKKN